MSMFSLTIIILAISCLAVMLLLGGVVVALWLQNRAAEKEESPTLSSAPRPGRVGGLDQAAPITAVATPPANWEEHILSLLQSGNKLEAIKIYRQATDVGLKEAKDAVEALERGQPVAIPAGAAPAQSASLEDQVRAALAQGSKIEAIKIYREATNLGLKEAKDAVEAIERGEPFASPPIRPGSSPASLEAQVRELLASSKKIEAIKIYREATNLDLKEAKDAVEAIERGLRP